MPGPDAMRSRGAGARELGLRDEQLVLKPREQAREIGIATGEEGPGEPQVGPYLIEVPDGRDAPCGLRYALTAQETGLAPVATTGV